MPRTRVSFLVGIAFLAIALIGFLTTGTNMEATMEHAPRLLGLFPVNLIHNLVHLAFGIAAVWAAKSAGAARAFLRIGGTLYLGLGLLGLIAPTTFGLIPIGGHNVWLHLALGFVMALFGFTAPATHAPVGMKGAR